MDHISVSGKELTGFFAHRDPLETCLSFRSRFGHLIGLKVDSSLSQPLRDVMIELASQFGQEHEQVVAAELQQKHGDQFVSIGQQEGDIGKEKQIELTLAAMQEGKAIIHSGYVRMSGWSEQCAAEVQRRFELPVPVTFWGEPDLLRRVDAPGCGSIFEDWFYEIADIKSARTSKMPARLQVAFYSWLLNDLQNPQPRESLMPAKGFVLPCAKEPDQGSITKWDGFDVEDVLPIAELFVREQYWSLVKTEPTEHLSTSGYQTPRTKLWAEANNLFREIDGARQPVAESELSALPGMRVQVRRALRPDVTTIEQLGALTDDEVKEIGNQHAGVSKNGLNKQRKQAQVCETGQPSWRQADFGDIQDVVNAVYSNSDRFDDVQSIELDNENIPIVHFDIEGHPFREIEYLWGYQVDLPGSRPRGKDKYGPVKQIWAEKPTAAEEQKSFETFLDHMEQIKADHEGELIIIHYATYEATRLKTLAKRYPSSLKKEDNLLRVEHLEPHLLDLYRVVQRAFYLPFGSYSIKDVAPGLARLPSPGGTGTEHQWLKFKTLDDLSVRLLKDGWSQAKSDQATCELQRAATKYKIDVETILDASANMSVFWYEQYCETGQPIWRHMIDVYNADDLVATQRLYDYLLRLQREGLSSIDDAPQNAEVQTA